MNRLRRCRPRASVAGTSPVSPSASSPTINQFLNCLIRHEPRVTLCVITERRPASLERLLAPVSAARYGEMQGEMGGDPLLGSSRPSLPRISSGTRWTCPSAPTPTPTPARSRSRAAGRGRTAQRGWRCARQREPPRLSGSATGGFFLFLGARGRANGGVFLFVRASFF